MGKQIRIAFTGPECSGKTTLSKWLSNEINGEYCEEYAREYLSNKKYQLSDIDHIGKKQIQLWDEKQNASLLIADTEFLVLKIWSEEKFKSCSYFIDNNFNKQKFDLYFLCKPDIPWAYDPLRESKNQRDELFKKYLSTLKEKDYNFITLSGNLEQRKKMIKKTLISLK